MKKNYLITGLLSLILTGCDGLLTMTPEDTLSPSTYFSSEKELQLWTNYFYSQFDTADTPTGQNADDNVDSGLGDLMMGQRSADSEGGWSWGMLRSINYYLQNSSNCKDLDAKTHYDGVAYFFRAYFYFVKVRRYGDVPWYDQVLKSTDDELLAKPRDDREYIMDLVMEDLDKAIENLPDSKSLTTVTKWTALALKSRVALYEGTFRKYHNLGNSDKFLQQAADAGKTFIEESGYSLYTSGNQPYRDLFNSDDAKSNEVILTRIYSSAANLMHSIQFNIINNRQGFTRRFINHYLMHDGSRFTDINGWEKMGYVDETQGRDPRLAQTVLCPGYIQTGASKVTANKLNAYTGYQPIKFVGAAAYDGSVKGISDWSLFRTAEVYLNFAEAKAELGTLTQEDLKVSINKLRDRAKMPHLVLTDANETPDLLLKSYYPNITNSENTGVLLEIRRERTIELAMEGFRQWDLLRWKEGAQFTGPFYGCYFPGEGRYDMDGDGKDDILLYTTDKGDFTGTAYKIGETIILSEGTSGYVVALSTLKLTWNEGRDYLWPIPSDQRVLTGGLLTQNPGWTDSTNYD